MRVAGVVLAAGFSTRLGRPKQELVLDASTGETLVERAVRVAIEAGLAPVIVVVKPTDEFGPGLRSMGAKVVLNGEAAEGMASSIRCGVDTAQRMEATGVVVMTCDQPAAGPQHLQALCREPGRVTGSRYAGRVGVPAYFPAAAFADLMALQGDAGARELLRGAAFVEDEALGLDIDCEADVVRAKASVGQVEWPVQENADSRGNDKVRSKLEANETQI